MTRVWLSAWEWECCGTPFRVGDEVELLVGPRMPWVDDLLGEELAATVDAVESHHDEPGPERLVGQVVGLHLVTHDMRYRRVERDPTSTPPMQSRLRLSSAEAEGGAWWFAVAVPSPYYVQGVGVAGTTRFITVDQVPEPRDPQPAEADARVEAASRGEGPAEWSSRSLAGYVVDLDDIVA